MEAYVTSVAKEMTKCEEQGRKEAHINYRPLFDEDGYNEPILSYIPPNPFINKVLHSRIKKWRDECSSKVHYPRASDRSMGHDTWEAMGNRPGMWEEGYLRPMMSTQRVWLRYYHESGVKAKGPTEMRTKWYPAHAKPRTYYAMGGTHYAASMYLQDTFTKLANCTPITHHKTRLRPTELRLKYGQRGRIYDFSNFTSNMDEQKYFCFQLAQFCMGYPYYYFDPREGVTRGDFGEMLLEYAEVCCDEPDLTYRRVSRRMGLSVAASRKGTKMKKASCLGIYGNLMTCTFLHGYVISQAVEDEDQVQVAGDDAIFAEDEDNEIYGKMAALSIGDFAPEKTFRTNDPPAICLKRPIEQVGVSIRAVPFVIPPSWDSLRILLRFKDTRFQDTSQTSFKDKMKVIGRGVQRYLRNLYRYRELFSEDELDAGRQLCISFVSRVKAEAMKFFKETEEDALDNVVYPYLPVSYEDLVSRDPFLSTLIRDFNGVFQGHLREVREYANNIESGEVEFECNSSEWLKLMETLEYVERVEAVQEVIVDPIAAWNSFLKIYDSYQLPVVYRFRLLKPIPFNLFV